LRRSLPHPLSQGHEKRLSRFDFATWPYLLLLVQHRDQSPLDAQKPNLSHVASRRSLRARFALKDLSRVPFPLPMIVAREGLIMPQIVGSSNVLSHGYCPNLKARSTPREKKRKNYMLCEIAQAQNVG
jgi:hypothetical protein